MTNIININQSQTTDSILKEERNPLLLSQSVKMVESTTNDTTENSPSGPKPIEELSSSCSPDSPKKTIISPSTSVSSIDDNKVPPATCSNNRIGKESNRFVKNNDSTNNNKRSRVVSLDRGKDMTNGKGNVKAEKDRSKNQSKDDRFNPNSEDEGNGDDEHSSGDDTSSDGESSYFAKHLPMPRKYSYSSVHSTSSAPARATGLSNKTPSVASQTRESDASLSFSDDDDEWNGDFDDAAAKGLIPSPSLLPPAPITTMASSSNKPGHLNNNNNNSGGRSALQRYSQGITRMHSASSLISSSSEENGTIQQQQPGDSLYDRRTANSTGLSGSESSHNTEDSDPDLASELRDVVSTEGAKKATSSDQNNRNISSRSSIPSGRKSPVQMVVSTTPNKGDQIDPYFAPSPNNNNRYTLQPSPPMIMNGYATFRSDNQGAVQPRPLVSELVAEAGMTAGNNVLSQYIHPQPQYYHTNNNYQVGYGATISEGKQLQNNSYLATSSSEQAGNKSEDSLALLYSDDDSDERLAFHMMTSGESRQVAAGREGAVGTAPFYNNNVPTENNLSGQHDGSGFLEDGDDATRQIMFNEMKAQSRTSILSKDNDKNQEAGDGSTKPGFKVYWRRWLMLMYMSVLNLLSDWTCYSVAPIATLTSKAYGKIDPELLVTIFLSANAIASACEPIILSRLGLRRTVIFGSLLLMIGSIVKSGGIPPIIQGDLVQGQDEWRVYAGFLLVGLSQPLYQCTPALLSASWFPEQERTMATGVALNANQLGIGFAFIFGTLLVATSDDIVPYFGLLSLISTITFAGCLIQFEDAPPTPPSDTAKIMRGTLEFDVGDIISKSVRNLPIVGNIMQPTNMSNMQGNSVPTTERTNRSDPSLNEQSQNQRQSKKGSKSKTGAETSSSIQQQATVPDDGKPRRRTGASSRNQSPSNDTHGVTAAPSSALPGPTDEIFRKQVDEFGVYAPSPMLPGGVGEHPRQQGRHNEEDYLPVDDNIYHQPINLGQSGLYPTQHTAQTNTQSTPPGLPPPYPMPPRPPPPHQYAQPYGYPPPYPNMPGLPVQPPYHYPYHYNPYDHQQAFYYPPPESIYHYPQPSEASYYHPPRHPESRPSLPGENSIEAMSEPVLTITPHHLDIDIRDDQVLLSIRACFSRAGFIHALVAFTASGIVINTLSTFMDYLVRLNGVGRAYVGIVGGSFQGVIMISSLVMGKFTDNSRAYYSVTIGMLVLGAFGLAECGVSLDEDRGTQLRWTLVIVAALVGPLQPISTELGVDVAYPLSENTVLVIQQLFSNLLSALFIPFFKMVKDVGRDIDISEMDERPEYTFSFYLLIVLHAAATVFFATFNGRYLRYEHEIEKKEREEVNMLREEEEQAAHLMGRGAAAFHPVQDGGFLAGAEDYYPGQIGRGNEVVADHYGVSNPSAGERQPLLNDSM